VTHLTDLLSLVTAGESASGMADPEPRTDRIVDGEPTLASGQTLVVAAVSGPTATGAAALAAA